MTNKCGNCGQEVDSIVFSEPPRIWEFWKKGVCLRCDYNQKHGTNLDMEQWTAKINSPPKTEIKKDISSWVPASKLGNSIVVDNLPSDTREEPFTVLSITRWIGSLQKLVGQPDSEQTKPLFEIVEALNKELLELRLKVEKLESAEVKK